jgi:aminoglycoside phosphotransferase (APT) family kinase protein
MTQDASDVTMNVQRAVEVIRAQFPEVQPADVQWLGEGYDSTAFEVNGEWVFRFPKRGDVEEQLLLEVRLLPVLLAESPIPLPDFAFRGTPSNVFPRHFSGYRKIQGVPALHVDDAAIRFDRIAPSLARFLSWLHALQTDKAVRLGVPKQPIADLIDDFVRGGRADVGL